jgi:hypothetical protein
MTIHKEFGKEVPQWQCVALLELPVGRQLLHP